MTDYDMRVMALNLAHSDLGGAKPERIIERAEVYYAFLSGGGGCKPVRAQPYDWQANPHNWQMNAAAQDSQG